MLISKKTIARYMAAMDKAEQLLDEKNKRIEFLSARLSLKDAEIKRLKRLLADNDIVDIDFPNSTEGGLEGSNIFFM